MLAVTGATKHERKKPSVEAIPGGIYHTEQYVPVTLMVPDGVVTGDFVPVTIEGAFNVGQGYAAAVNCYLAPGGAPNNTVMGAAADTYPYVATFTASDPTLVTIYVPVYNSGNADMNVYLSVADPGQAATGLSQSVNVQY